MRSIALVVCAVLVVALAACGSGEVRVTDADDGKTVELRKGQVLVVELPGNPTTGYSWLEASAPDMLASQGEPTFKAESDALGAGGMMTLRYDATKAGEGKLELSYARPWESVEPLKTFSVTVTVKP